LDDADLPLSPSLVEADGVELLMIRGVDVAIAAAMLLMLCGGCSEPASDPPHLLKKSEMTPAEIKFGRAPKRDRTVAYQPNVILVDRGAEAIRSLAPDGLTWVIDARASHASEIAVGKIAFVTGRCIGRVLLAKRDGDNLTLVLGPVELTEVFRKLDVTLDQPIDFVQAIEYPGPELPGLQLPLEGPEAAPPSLAAVPRVPVPANSSVSSGRSAPLLQTATYRFLTTQGSPGILPQPPKVGFEATKPLSNADGIGVELRHEGHGVRLVAQAQIRVKNPRLEFHLGIDNGKVDAKVILHNAAGLKLAFDSAVNEEFSGNVNWYSPAPGGLTIPISGPVPLSIDVRQEIWVQTAFSAKRSSFSAGGDYGLNADIGFTYQGGNFSLVGPKGLTVRKSLMSNMTGVSIGPSDLQLSHVLTLTAGLGMGGFTTGPSIEIATSVRAALGSTIGVVQCRGATLAMNLKGGVGWTIPRPIARFVNFFLNIVHVRPIQDHGGIFSPWKELFHQQAQTASQICGGPGG
jgi:hypothetical protein